MSAPIVTDEFADLRDKVRHKYVPVAEGHGLDAADVEHVLGHIDFVWLTMMVGPHRLWAEADHWMPRYLAPIIKARESGQSATEARRACIVCNMPPYPHS